MESITKHDKILYSIQQLDEMRFPESVVTKGKIDSDLVALEELKRRKEKLHINADTNGVFVLRNYPVHRGAFISKGTVVGDILSGNIIINAYADEREIGKLSPGSKAVVYTRDSLKKYKAEITGINTIPVTLNESPVLQSNGGVIPVYFDENKKCFSADRTLYRVTLELKEKCDLSTGRFVTVKVSNTGQLYKPLFRFIISAFRKEF